MSAINRLFYSEELPDVDGLFRLTDHEEFRHVSVMRPETGDLLNFTDGKGKYAACRVLVAEKRYLDLLVIECRRKKAYPQRITVAFALTKRSKWEMIIEKGTEMGVSVFVPLITSRNAEFAKGNKYRWDRSVKIAIEAMKQSRRVYLPDIKKPMKLKKIFTDLPRTDRMLLLSFGGKKGIKLDTENERELMVLVGPEGGFDPREEKLIEDSGGEGISLGEYTLKTETAAMKIISLVTHECGDF